MIGAAAACRFPRRWIYLALKAVAGLLGAGFVVAAQRWYDRIVKGKRTARGGSA